MERVDAKLDIKNYLAGSFKAEVNKAKKDYTDLMRSRIEVSPERLEKDFKQAIKDVAKPYEKLQLAFNAAVAQGKDEDEIYDLLINKGISEDVADMLIEGQAFPALIVYSDLEKQAERDIEAAESEEEAAKIEDRWYKKLDILDEFLDKYEGMTLDEVKKGALNG